MEWQSIVAFVEHNMGWQSCQPMTCYPIGRDPETHCRGFQELELEIKFCITISKIAILHGVKLVIFYFQWYLQDKKLQTFIVISKSSTVLYGSVAMHTPYEAFQKHARNHNKWMHWFNPCFGHTNGEHMIFSDVTNAFPCIHQVCLSTCAVIRFVLIMFVYCDVPKPNVMAYEEA